MHRLNCNCNRLFRKYHTVLTFSFLFSSATQKLGPLVGIEKRIKSGLEYIEPDFFGDYVSGKLCSCSFSSSLPIIITNDTINHIDCSSTVTKTTMMIISLLHPIINILGMLTYMLSISFHFIVLNCFIYQIQ